MHNFTYAGWTLLPKTVLWMSLRECYIPSVGTPNSCSCPSSPRFYEDREPALSNINLQRVNGLLRYIGTIMVDNVEKGDVVREKETTRRKGGPRIARRRGRDQDRIGLQTWEKDIYNLRGCSIHVQQHSTRASNHELNNFLAGDIGECYLAKKSAKASLTTFKETNTDVDRNIYVSNRKRYTTLINFNKKKYLQEKQELLKNARDSANFWKTIATLKDKSYIQGNITILEWQCFYNKLLSAETTIGSDLSTLSRIDPELYCEISTTEITREISSLANEKACGADEIPNEALKTLPSEHLVTLKNIQSSNYPSSTVFNRIINSGSYPLIWSKSIIHPIFKSGDQDNPSNYRGIALISRSIIPENQAGFRKGYSCQDHIFTLLSLIQLTLRRKRRKLYAFFVDLKKAFDTVPHSLLWSKLGELGLDFRFVNLIRNYFEQMTTTVRWNGLFTEPIKIRSGVLQREPLSPYLFILFVTDLINIFNDSTLPGIYLPNFGTVHLLMYADDIILIGESKINLQIKINMLKKYFETNHLTLNESKSKIMVFRNVTSKYLYLGYPRTTTISFSQVASYFKGKALAATGEVWKIMEKSRLNSFGSSMKLLDSIILSTLLYSAPIWANKKYKILDQIQNNYLRRLLNLPSNTPGYILRMETGRFSLGVTATKLILKFWLRILKMEKSRLPAICLAQLWETSTLTNTFIGFTENLMNILNSTGFMWLKNCSNPNILQKAIPQIIRITIEQSIQTDQSRITNSKLHTHYKYLHKTFAAENYLQSELPLPTKRLIAQLRILFVLYREDHIKYLRTEDLYCQLCKNRTENELEHYIFECMPLDTERKILFSKIGHTHFTLYSLLSNFIDNSSVALNLYNFHKNAEKKKDLTEHPNIPKNSI
ncbi:hypothetical protein LAZ67_5000699 [Cordylochernes scorpioides]|uniref:Reverse transcriptase domain-containing protein n=1 Tax=Cordylochernes scorpioides TaxID=51811 RepID=A0ABY6KGA5_9ARAC|nr:hypothetical protein LAZ67_5000699 [Cordylochernes scorpioides]